ncbi:NAD(P)/FAD-dependent oxidoreductase [Rhodospirillum centenum]|uniref:FAD dependent oxidoreductase, putative n=1 Tax=Rhodospirillum centenum (strain ATCC 51521 / SW) TaxID=414684 RepID=B6IXN4_RHOCS|nr:FAD-binding oxidoreductase [Rhodospirillum centenum]ACJ01058.1 FAD dependent oxidoreductase, putative [Rhodospirillum centenum SW]
MEHRADIVVIGAGIAGLSVAAFLAPRRRVLVLEAEAQPGYHASGRTAALFAEAYGNAPVRALTRASRPFFETPPAGFCDQPLLHPRGTLFIATHDQAESLAATAAEIGPALLPLDPDQAVALVPRLRRERLLGALHDPTAADIDAHALMQGFVRMIREAGGTVLTDRAADAIDRTPDGWRIRAGGETVAADLLVDAAGAWGDRVAALAGIAPVGLEPKRRTAFLFDPPAGPDTAGWPMVMDVDEGFYVKPESGRLLGSPADESPSEPCDAQPDDYDIAVAAERIQEALDLEFRTLKAKWAGLRTFAPDRTPVAGFDPADDRFFWLVGQGGYGMQTAPALGRLAAGLILDGSLPQDCRDEGVAVKDLAPGRFGGR